MNMLNRCQCELLFWLVVMLVSGFIGWYYGRTMGMGLSDDPETVTEYVACFSSMISVISFVMFVKRSINAEYMGRENKGSN